MRPLRTNGLAHYDTLKLLELTEGRNSQDDCFLETIATESAPSWFREREAGRIVDAVPLKGNRIVVAFRTGDVCFCSVEELVATRPELARPLANRDAFERMAVALGGREVCWGSTIAVSDSELRSCGKPVALTWDDLATMAPVLLVDAAEAADMLDCTRQNVNALAKREALPVVKAGKKATLFLRADVRSRLE